MTSEVQRRIHGYERALAWVRSHPRLFPLLIDSAIWIPAIISGTVLKLAFGWRVGISEAVILGSIAIVIQGGIGTFLGVYRHKWRVTSFEEVTGTGLAWFSATVVIGAISVVSRETDISDLPNSAVVMGVITVSYTHLTLPTILRVLVAGSSRLS